MKTFMVDAVDSSVSAEVAQLVGLPPHRHQAEIYVSADTKSAAVNLVGSLPTRWAGDVPAWRLRMGMGNDLDALTAAGLFNGPAILVVAAHGGDRPVVQVTNDGPAVIGQLFREHNGGRRFEPAGTLHLTLPPGQAAAVRELIAMAPASVRADALRALLPAELLGDHGPA